MEPVKVAVRHLGSVSSGRFNQAMHGAVYDAIGAKNPLERLEEGQPDEIQWK